MGRLISIGVRRRWVGTIALTILIGLAAGTCLAAWAGARRTESAYPRMLEVTNAEDATLFYETPPPPAELDAIRSAPGVQAVSAGVGFGSAVLDEAGLPQLDQTTVVVAPTDSASALDVGGFLITDGRTLDLDADDEVLINAALRDRGHPVGSTLPLCIYSFAELGGVVLPEQPTEEEARAAAEQLYAFREFEVVGVLRTPSDIAATESTEQEAVAAVGPALAADAPKPASYGFVQVDLRSPEDLGAFTEWATGDENTPRSVGSSGVRIATVERAADPYVRTLRIFAIVGALASLAVLGPGLIRWAALRTDERTALHALGVTRRQLRTVALARTAAVALVASVLAAFIAVAASPLFPIGPTAAAEPDAGVRPDVLVLLVGTIALVAAGTAIGLLVQTRDRRGRASSSALTRRLTALGATPAMWIGIRSALTRGTADNAGPVTAAAGVIAAIIAVTAALTFGSSLNQLISQPELYGWTWDAVYDPQDDGLDPAVLAFIEDDPRVAGVTEGFRVDVTVDGVPLPAHGFDPGTGGPLPEILDGRAPTTADEVALGGQTMQRLDLDLGDTFSLTTQADGSEREVTVVGRTLLPLLNVGEDASVGEGMYVAPPALEGVESSFRVIDLAPGTDLDAVTDDLLAAGLLDERNVNKVGPQLPSDLRSYQQVRSTPLLLAGMLALLGAGVLTHTVVMSTRRRSRELAVLRALGLRRRSASATVVWHSVTLMAVAVLVGVPGGVIVGRAMWQAFGEGLGVDPSPAVPIPELAGAAVAALGLSVLLALVPAVSAGRRRPAVDLAAE